MGQAIQIAEALEEECECEKEEVEIGPPSHSRRKPSLLTRFLKYFLK